MDCEKYKSGTGVFTNYTEDVSRSSCTVTTEVRLKGFVIQSFTESGTFDPIDGSRYVDCAKIKQGLIEQFSQLGKCFDKK